MERFDPHELKEHAHIHFIGIGGISMSGLALIAAHNGYTVSGSDRASSAITKRLEDHGITICIGHDAKNVAGADLVVYTAAIKADNPEYIEAQKESIHLIDRAEFLGAIMKNYPHAVAVAGTHGKTTTTSMLTHIFMHADLDPTISVGGELDIIDGNVRCGKSDYFITEACEYTNSFLKFYPTLAVITNIDADHLDFFRDMDDIRNSFRRFAMLTKDKGYVVAMYDDENVRIALKDAPLNIITYGMKPANDYYPQNITFNAGFPSFEVMKKGQKLCSVHLNVPGEHNILNAVASIAAGDILGIDAATSADGVATFKGTHRRFEKKGMLNGAVVLDDYAHHPTEIKATLKAAAAFPHNKIRCVFQPHTYSRTRLLWNEFRDAFSDADELIITHIYPAREPFDGVTKPENLVRDINEAHAKNAMYIDDFSEIADYLRKNAEKGDIIFTMGAGDVTVISDMLTENQEG